MRRTQRDFGSIPRTNDLDSLSFVSRQLGPDAASSGTSLRDHAVQERFLEHILSKPRASQVDLDHLVMSVRKLREGVLASGRVDAFAVRVYETAARICIEAGHTAELFKSLIHLVRELYPAVPPDSAETQALMSGCLLLLLVCDVSQAGDPERCHGDAREIVQVYSQLPDGVRSSSPVERAMRLLSALVRDIDYVALSRVLAQAGAVERRLIAGMLARARPRILRILARAYFTIPLGVLLRHLCLDGDGDGDGGGEDALAQLLADVLPARPAQTQAGVVALRAPPGQRARPMKAAA
ncbi:hypothetical protein HK105_204050 [Polyrhizophydium stewartii]|uniref:Uncharacterized protein n=1 Tax=Polyrhizophydium stewartii TaxID=2732419 RepID=A0ABR4NA16_9FUNG|nr:hypothetical protein HK105_004665 [Polyrhizophydium stewartii]